MNFSKIDQGRSNFMDSKIHELFLLKYRETRTMSLSSVLKSTAVHAGITAAMNHACVNIRTFIILGQGYQQLKRKISETSIEHSFKLSEPHLLELKVANFTPQHL